MPGSDPERRAQNLLEQFHKQEVETDSKYLLGSREKARFWFCDLHVEDVFSLYLMNDLGFPQKDKLLAIGGGCKILKVIEVLIIEP